MHLVSTLDYPTLAVIVSFWKTPASLSPKNDDPRKNMSIQMPTNMTMWYMIAFLAAGCQHIYSLYNSGKI